MKKNNLQMKFKILRTTSKCFNLINLKKKFENNM